MTSILYPIVHAVGARQPPLYGTLTSDDPAFDPIPAGATATFYMRNVNGSTLKVPGSAAVVTSEPGNTLRYDWAALDVDTAGVYVGWWRVTLAGGQYVETPEFLIEFKAHAPAAVQYVSADELKQTLALKADYANADIQLSVEAASRAIDTRTGRNFTLGTPGEARTFRTSSPGWVEVDDVNSITAVAVDGVTLTAGTDYLAILGGVGWPIAELRAQNGYQFPTRQDVIVVTGTYGWTAVPAQIKSAARIIATRLLRRTREAAFGVVGLGFEGAAVHIARFDPDLDMLLSDFERSGGSLAQA